ncbi:metallophosphoesterase family protein [Brevibacillus agri]|uniref:metallophosphoesterase family protein n=1 Tax=Brevibacillus TaxID=55080 RepID=UPI001EE5E07A|nr:MULTISPECIES: metallophosphoesterase family protein [Brevibacillus]MCG5252454.1 serine/threonine protein phosphatase [Brevibacillus agri]MCM3472209.1 serine/threonine protein phosphatase [Brevibacillus borstelensis]MED1646700.1 metallophosphoesterase family protein [Brevibacillus agri]MED1657700.1 metallophosphoesterase family protein [Brevibacillus agri]MED1689501.1 metallophosphoesterase family protein [Brevibacillus agri]
MKFFMTDIHGDLKGMKLLLKHVGVDLSKDQLVFGGDMINRGRDSAGVVKEVKALMEKYPQNLHAVIGNHEEMMSWYYERGDRLWLNHGGKETIESFHKTFPDVTERQTHIEWAASLPLYYEDDEFIYTHAGLNPYEPIDSQSREIVWMDELDFYSIPKEALLVFTQNKPIIHGHTPVERIYFDGVRINCDLGSNTYSIIEERGLALVNLNEMIYWVYKPAQKKIEKRKIGKI